MLLNANSAIVLLCTSIIIQINEDMHDMKFKKAKHCTCISVPLLIVTLKLPLALFIWTKSIVYVSFGLQLGKP